MEIAMIKDKVVEYMKATMTRFLDVLNGKITNVVELQHFVELRDMIHMNMKVERQLEGKDMFNQHSIQVLHYHES